MAKVSKATAEKFKLNTNEKSISILEISNKGNIHKGLIEGKIYRIKTDINDLSIVDSDFIGSECELSFLLSKELGLVFKRNPRW